MSPTTTPRLSNPNAASIAYLSPYLPERRPRRCAWRGPRAATGQACQDLRTPCLSFHSFDPLSPRGPWVERLTKVLRLADHLATLKFHDADHVIRLPVVREDEFADPKIAAAKHAPQSEAFRVRLGDARRLNVGSAANTLARLWILENCVGPVDLVLR